MAIGRADIELADLSDIATDERLAVVAPGAVLHEEFMAPLGLSARALARDTNVPRTASPGS